jgi:hypothetical protein
MSNFGTPQEMYDDDMEQNPDQDPIGCLLILLVVVIIITAICKA